MKKLAIMLVPFLIASSSYAGHRNQQRKTQRTTVQAETPDWTYESTMGSDHWNQFVKRCMTEDDSVFGTQHDARTIEVSCRKDWYHLGTKKIAGYQKNDDGKILSYSRYNLEGPKGQTIDVQPEMSGLKMEGSLETYSLDKLVAFKNTKVWGYDKVSCKMIREAFCSTTSSNCKQQQQQQEQQQQAEMTNTSREEFCGYLEGYLEENGVHIPVETKLKGDAVVPQQVLQIEGPRFQ